MQQNETLSCIFCRIRDGQTEASKIYEDDLCLAFMGIRPARTGECMIIPREHIDHFTDISDDVVAHIVLTAQRIGKKMLDVLDPKPKRIGYIVHGFGVPHAHFIVTPQHEHDDITSGRHLSIKDGAIIADETIIPLVPRAELDRMANLLKFE